MIIKFSEIKEENQHVDFPQENLDQATGNVLFFPFFFFGILQLYLVNCMFVHDTIPHRFHTRV